MGKTIAFIGGGQMAEALISGILAAATFTAEQIGVVEPNSDRRAHLEKTYGVLTAESAQSIVPGRSALLLAVKPQMMETALQQIDPLLENHLVITIAAGLPLSFYEKRIGSTVPLIRVMPNTPALALEGASALCGNHQASEQDLDFAMTLFRSVGFACVVEERLLDAVTGLSGSGPADVFAFIEALVDGGIRAGLSHQIATDLAIQTVLGAARLAKVSGDPPAVLRARVSSPGGTTIDGLYALESGAFRALIMDAVDAATQRSRELSGDK